MDMGLACRLPRPWPLLLSTLTGAALLSQSLALFPSLTLGTKYSLLSYLVSTQPGLLWPWAQTPIIRLSSESDPTPKTRNAG